ncbi:MAG: site-2 protease family protein [Polyangiaceae bacterium]|nr:site-2 protease family protein [Polyangiaceae bacterium]
MFDLSPNGLMLRVMMLIPLLLSLSVHEWAHAWSAYRLGDDTASRQGRLTLDPLAHIDPIGTFLLPLMGIPFGWAKPVPVNPARFRRDVSMRTGMMITAAAGPISNIILALLATVITALLIRFQPDLLAAYPAVSYLLGIAIQMNVALAIFNLLPIPPLDGSRVVDGLVPYRYQGTWEKLTRFAPLLLLGVILSGGFILAGPIAAVNGLLMDLLRAIVA